MGKGKALGGLAVAAGVVWAVAAAQRPKAQTVVELPAPAPEPACEPAADPAPPGLGRRFAASLALCLVFFAGAALAAGAGNELVSTPPAVDAGATDPAVSTDTVTAVTTVTTATSTTDPATTDAVATTTTTEPDPSDATPAPAPLPAPETAAAVVPPAPVAVPAPRPAPKPTPTPTRLVRVAQPRAVVPPVVSPFPVVPFEAQTWLADNPGTPVGDAAVALAEHLVGVPYRWGGNTPATGFDCSGLTQYVYAQLGIWLPHYAAAQFLAYPRLDPSQLEPGDLVFFEPKADGPGHVAIYAGNGEIVEAPHTGADVRVGSLAGEAASLGFLGAVRPSQLAGAESPAPVRDIAGRFVAA